MPLHATVRTEVLTSALMHIVTELEHRMGRKEEVEESELRSETGSENRAGEEEQESARHESPIKGVQESRVAATVEEAAEKAGEEGEGGQE